MMKKVNLAHQFAKRHIAAIAALAATVFSPPELLTNIDNDAVNILKSHVKGETAKFMMSQTSSVVKLE